ncbi:pyocin knob domain-containing protein [Phocaeicola vulgatus]|nr:pyocin knob domain-containing protein [Phocaeicola vulgatus]MCS2554551.1 pyocin knob domain-containing protein [Phocaeicola vulgatus]MCS2995640.1 pyocin knob domain-containing protein [Phocaeicola vulgatus]
MSDLNLENIVGFKAVDKNGNERQVTVDEMTELVSARIVSAASEISTFAAAAAAGTDEFEDQLPQSDTFSWLRTLDGSKNPTLTSSSAAAKVLGELMNNLKLFPFMGMADISEGGDANELESGYYINGNFRKLTNSPFSSGWGGIIVFKINYYTLQIASDMNTKIFKVRQRWYNTWDDWKTVSLT